MAPGRSSCGTVHLLACLCLSAILLLYSPAHTHTLWADRVSPVSSLHMPHRTPANLVCRHCYTACNTLLHAIGPAPTDCTPETHLPLRGTVRSTLPTP